jgi:lysozyme
MKTSIEGLVSLVAHEGIVLSRYKDSVGVFTIGVGHTKAAGGINPETFTGTLTIAQVFDMLKEDIVKYENGVNKAVTVPLKQHEFDALVSFHYNTGAIGKASFVKKLNAGDRAGAAKGMMDWRKPPEIIPRRTAERDLFLHGKYSGPFATIYPATPSGSVQWGKGKLVNVRDMLAKTIVVDDPGPKPTPKPIIPPSTPKPSSNWLTILLDAIAKAFRK